jgi:hypothetical protein
MKPRFVLLSAVLLSFLSVKARAFPAIVFFPTKGDFTKLRIHFLDGTQLAKDENACKSEQTCADRYWLQRKVKGDDSKRPVVAAGVTPSVIGDILDLDLAQSVDDPSDLFVIVADEIVLKDGKPKSVGWKDYAVAPQVEQASDLEKPTLRYASLTPFRLDDTPQQRRTISQNLSVTDPDDSTLRYNVFVTKLQTEGKGDHPTHLLTLAGLPRGKKVKVAVKGVEQFKSKDVSVDPTTIDPVPFPKGRDDAAFFVNASADADDVGGKKKYKLDTRIHPAWIVGPWEIGPTLDGTIGNQLSKAPNTASLSADFRRFFASDATAVFPTQSVLLSPTFRTDRKFKNRDVELDLAWEPRLRWFEGNTLERRRADLKIEGGIPRSIHFGFSVRPSIGLEGGRHIGSSDPQVDDRTFTRARGSLSAKVQWWSFVLSTSSETRTLFSNEVVLDDSGKVVKTAKGLRSSVRFDLSYDLGAVALTVTRINGRQPPAFSPTRSTSFGVTLKF